MENADDARKPGNTLETQVLVEWVASCFVEGYGSFKRIKQIVKEQKAKNGKSQ
jgi:hypothetical protein